MKSCVWMPKNKARKELSSRLRRDFGPRMGSIIYNKTTGEEFMSLYKDSLTISEGIPTYESIVSNSLVKDYIGTERMLIALNRQQPHLDNTLDNTALLINKAADFNRDPTYSDYVAIVDYDEQGRLTLSIEPRNEKTLEIAVSQHNIQKLNEKVAELLTPLGITISNLSDIEVAAGRVGLTNFNRAKDLADGFTGLLRVANNMEGHNAISEEFAHFVIGVFRNSPLVQRTINLLKNEDEAREVLGNEDYERYVEYYGGNTDAVAEEAAGHILQQALISTTERNKPKRSLFKRMVDFILNIFKGMNPAYYQDSIDSAIRDMNTFAESIMSSDKKITKKKIADAYRNIEFNALSERANTQVEILRNIVERDYKNAALQLNSDDLKTETRRAMDFAKTVKAGIEERVKKEETMAAIASYITEANRNIDGLIKSLSNLDSLPLEERFIVLRDILTSLQKYSPTIDDLYSITTQEYLNDEGISSQEFMLDDYSNNLEDYKASDDNNNVDTSSMSVSEIADRIVRDSSDWKLSEDETHYENVNTGAKGLRVTTTIAADEEAGSPFDANNPWVTPSTNIGTGVDELVRDIISGRVYKDGAHFKVDDKYLSNVYPNATGDALDTFTQQVVDFKEAEEAKGITFISRDVTVNGTVSTVDGTGKVHKVNVVGTVDLLGYDKDGNWYLYDMKTHRGTIDDEKKAKYERQVSLYKRFLEEKYGIKIKSLSIIPIKVNYPAPVGTTKGTATYSVSDTKPEGYNGVHPNQLLVDGTPFKGAKPNLENIISINERELHLRYDRLSGDPTNGLGAGGEAVIKALDAMNRKFKGLSKEFSEKAMPQFLEFLKPFVGENISVRDLDKKTGKFTGKMKKVSIEEVIKNSPKDVTLAQRWLTSMADNPDALLQIFDKVVKRAKDKKRLRVIEAAQEIQALGIKYEKLGITSYDWMFEDDKKNYVSRTIINGKDYSFDRSSYEKAKSDYIKLLDEQYGEHPTVGSKEYKEKNEKRKKWIKDNTVTVKDNTGTYTTIPIPSKYPSRYNSFSETQKKFYDEWMAIKGELDLLIGSDKTYLTNTIKIRKTGIERLKSTLSGNGIMEFVENVKAKTMRSFDDDTNYESKGIRGFNGEEIMRLPLYYINDKGDSKDISTDAIGTLIAYAEMAYNYDAMNQVVNPLEIGRFIASQRKINKMRGDKRVFEDFTYGGTHIHNPLYTSTESSNFKDVLDDFFSSKIYQRYLSDNGEIAGVDVNKATGILLKIGSAVQLGFNALAGMANIATGVAMQNIEAAAGEFFNARQLAKADKTFIEESGDFVLDIGQRVKKSKLALFDEMFDVRQNFSKNIKHKDFLNKTILTRIFGPSIQYICQDAGDHWLYNRSAIAIAQNYKLLDSNNNEISLWDALEVVPVDKNDPDLGNRLVLKEGVRKTDGTAFTEDDISDISGRMRYINQHCFGIYNDEDSIAARRTIVGRMIMQYRDWIPAQFRYRFGAASSSLEKGDNVEGYYRTTGRFIKQIFEELRNGEKTIPQLWDQLDVTQRANIRRTIAEITQFTALCIVAALLRGWSSGPDKKHKGWLERLASYANYLLSREKVELGALIPIPMKGFMPSEMITMLKSPFACTSVISDITNLSILLWPPNYFDTIKSGDYKDHSSAYRAFMRSPLTLWYRTINRNLNPEKAEERFQKN